MKELNKIGCCIALAVGLLIKYQLRNSIANTAAEVDELLNKFEVSDVTDNFTLPETVVIAYVACGKGAHLDMAFVSIKSAVIFSTSPLHFVIISDQSHKIFEDFFGTFQSESRKFAELSFEVLHPVFPANVPQVLMEMYRPCASYRLYFPEVLAHHKKLIYLDTDTVWLESPSVLWGQFNKGQGVLYQVAQDNRDSLQVQPYSRYPGPRPAGLGSGVMLMDLERLRATNFMDIASEFLQLEGLILPDQTFIGSLSRHRPEVFRQLPAKFNVQPVTYGHVSQEQRPEEDTYHITDIGVLHGSCKTFLNRWVFESWFKTATKFDWSAVGPDFILGSLKWSLVFTFPQPVYFNTYELIKKLQPSQDIQQTIETELKQGFWSSESNVILDTIHLTNVFRKIVKRKFNDFLLKPVMDIR